MILGTYGVEESLTLYKVYTYILNLSFRLYEHLYLRDNKSYSLEVANLLKICCIIAPRQSLFYNLATPSSATAKL